MNINENYEQRKGHYPPMHHIGPGDLQESSTVRGGTEDVPKRNPPSPDQIRIATAPGEGLSGTEAVKSTLRKTWSDYRTPEQVALVREMAKRLRDHRDQEPGSKVYFITIVEPRLASSMLSEMDRRRLTPKAAKVHGSLRKRTVRAYHHLNKLFFSKKEIEAGNKFNLFFSVDDDVAKRGFNPSTSQGPHIHGLVSVPGRHVERFEKMIARGNLKAIFSAYIDDVGFHIREVKGDLEKATDYSLKYVFTLKDAESDTHHPWQYHPMRLTGV